MLVDTFDVGIELQVQAALGQFFLQMFAHRTIKAAQEQVTAIQQGSVCTQAVEDAGELNGDITAAHHQHALG